MDAKQRLEAKNLKRLEEQCDCEEESTDVAIYIGLSGENIQGSRHAVEFPNDGGVSFGEFISPNAPAIGSKVAVSYAPGGCLFDTM